MECGVIPVISSLQFLVCLKFLGLLSQGKDPHTICDCLSGRTRYPATWIL
jgi:hypothetical protein